MNVLVGLPNMTHFETGYHLRDFLNLGFTPDSPFTVFDGKTIFNSVEEYKAYIWDNYALKLEDLP